MKTSRRNFLAITGGTLIGAAVHAARRSAPAAANGKPFIVDCQSHLFCPELVALMEKRDAEPLVRTRDGERLLIMGDWVRKIPPAYFSVEAKLAAMNANGIALTALSINDPGPEWFGQDGAAVARVANDFVAEVARQHPARFFGLCVLPWQDVDAATAELERCVRKLGFKGLLLYTNLLGRFPDEPQFRPVLARAAELSVPVLLHPAKPVTIEFVKGYEMTAALGNMFENTIALTRLIMSGVLDELPNLKLVCPHLGGTLPYIVGRLDHQTQVLKRGPRNLKRPPSEYLKRVWLDTASTLPQAVKLAYELIGADRLLFASDHPWVDPALTLDALRKAKLPAADETRILGGNARKLFGL
ncbi:MAG: amidohydrolase family protein [Verrucomicrobiae bacterium]|nr:amidohydrolase family protein [Verrucomicrobiae bacterium]